MRAKDKAGIPVPWAYARRQIAEQWGVPPWVVDEAPRQEIELELRIREIEAECRPAEQT